jgi:hypothetical protein
VASGGIASAALSRSLDVRLATDVLPVGLIGDEKGRPLNVADFALEPVHPCRERPRTVAVIGTSMNSGKTTTIHFMVHGLSRAGVRAGVTKVTGTGSGGDYWVMIDAGAHRMLDFPEGGLASTYRQPMSLISQTFLELLDHLSDSGTDVNFVEVADGIYQRETSRLIESEIFRSTVDVVLFAAGDAMGAAAGVTHLRGLGLNVAAVSGRITRSPLATREVQTALGMPVLGLAELDDPVAVSALIGLPAEVLDQRVPAPAIPWPAAEPCWEQAGAPVGAIADAAILAEEHTAIQMTEQR